MTKALASVAEVKGCRAGERVSFRARVLRLWEVGGRRMCLVGDESALTRVDLPAGRQGCGEAAVEVGRSYEFREALVREYPSTSLRTGPSASLRAGPGGWHSASLVEGSAVAPLGEDVPVSQDEAYIERTYRILAGVQRKKARKAGLIEPWRHPAKGGGKG